MREQDRLRAVHAIGAAEAAGPEFDRIARLAARLSRAPVGLVTIVDDQGVWCPARFGFDRGWVAHAQSFCAVAITLPGVTVVPDAAQDPRFAASGLVAGPPGVRFYAGAPVITPGGLRIGMVCVLDTVPRPGLAMEVQEALVDLAALAALQHEQRQAARQDAEKERQRQDAYFRALFENNPLAMFVYDIETARIAEVNRTALETYGCTRAAFLARPLATLVQDEKGRSLAEGLAAPRSGPGNGLAARNWTYRRSDGTTRRARIATHDMTFDGHRRWLIALWDMTEVEQARLALQAAAAALQARTAELMEVNRRARLGMWRFPLEGGGVSWSDEIFEMFGRSPAAPAAVDVLNWVHPEDRPAVEAAFLAAAATQAEQAFEFRAVRPDGRIRYCLADLHPELAPDGGCVAMKGFCQDVTERRETELALLHSEKLRAIGQFTGGVAHDFNNLLTVTLLSLEEAIESLLPGDPLLEPLESALHASIRGRELTAQLLSYARNARLEPARIDLDAFFRRLLPLLRRSLGDRYRVNVRPGPGVGQPFGDVAKLESAVMNLVLNARDAMPRGGTIMIETATVSLAADDAGFAGPVTPGPYTVIRVSDTGDGIPPDVLPRIFDPFFTTKPAGKGSGLGLSVMYGFVKQSGGHVTAMSRVGVGSAISIYLPVREEG